MANQLSPDTAHPERPTRRLLGVAPLVAVVCGSVGVAAAVNGLGVVGDVGAALVDFFGSLVGFVGGPFA
jgi:hypothetical protein